MENRNTSSAEPVPEIRQVAVDRPWAWLAAGWHDMTRVPGRSLLYGVVFAAAGYALTYWLNAAGAIYLILPVAAGFALIGPAAAVGLYDVCRRLEQGQPVPIGSVFPTILSRADTFGAMGLVLVLFFLAWMEIALLMFAFFFSDRPISSEDFIEHVFFAPESLPFLVSGTVAGGILAAAVFAISAVSLPLLLDRNVGVPTAVITSLRVVRRNYRALALWAALIAFFISLGVATLFLGLVITLPLIGYATWHAYRDLVEPAGGDRAPAPGATS
ncbi:MAG: DUF2189 domain-containing protein [Rhodospirillales bacterium]|nr:MAG: DUF2189 domain-containing protein [Rhodospirillales bacterium]